MKGKFKNHTQGKDQKNPFGRIRMFQLPLNICLNIILTQQTHIEKVQAIGMLERIKIARNKNH